MRHIADMSHNISLTANAAARINRLSAEAGHPVMLRVTVEGGGCSGFQYKLDLTDKAQADESEISYNGAKALVDEISAPLMAGSIIDFVEELVGIAVQDPQPAGYVVLRLRHQFLAVITRSCVPGHRWSMSRSR
ncbi:MAG: iron-sulfur cluster assembly accessory protein [Asticcacaulis sp.]